MMISECSPVYKSTVVYAYPIKFEILNQQKKKKLESK